MNFKLKLLTQTYLDFLQEREWGEPTPNPDTFDIRMYQALLGKLISNEKIKAMRHAFQPSLYNIYIKNSLGDYKGRPYSANAKTIRHIGLSQFDKDEERLRKIVDYLNNFEPKDPLGKLKIIPKKPRSKYASDSKLNLYTGDNSAGGGDSGDSGGGGE
jgi:hypothetical protein